MPTVLLVDDSPVVRRVLARRLESEGFDVREEGSAAAARGVDAASLDCAIIDVELADGFGGDVAAELRGRRPSLPIAFFTAGAGAPLVEQARAHGPVFTKPDVEAIVAWVTSAPAGAPQPPPTK
ncbi:MAG TPA: response regulator [Polyangiaceae bacterium]|jgi:CheY-like chemotaxis protein